MATAEELQRFISKRGFKVEVDKLEDGRTFVVNIQCKTVDEVKNLLASIEEPGRFVVAVEFSDVAQRLLEVAGISEEFQSIHKEIEDMVRTSQKLEETDETLRKQSESSIGALVEKTDKLLAILKLQDARLAKLEKTPWWKKWR